MRRAQSRAIVRCSKIARIPATVERADAGPSMASLLPPSFPGVAKASFAARAPAPARTAG